MATRCHLGLGTLCPMESNLMHATYVVRPCTGHLHGEAITATRCHFGTVMCCPTGCHNTLVTHVVRLSWPLSVTLAWAHPTWWGATHVVRPSQKLCLTLAQKHLPSGVPASQGHPFGEAHTLPGVT